jgi:hypothetical protein
MAQIEDLRRLSVNARLAVTGQQPSTGRSHSIEAPIDGMKRQPSVESVNSCYSSTKTGKEKNSAGGFGRNAKKGWVSTCFCVQFSLLIPILNFCCPKLLTNKYIFTASG